MSNPEQKTTTQAHKLLLELRNNFLVELPEKVDDLETMVLALERPSQEHENFNTLYRNVHSLKGSAGTHGISTITFICHQIEDALTELGESHQASAELIDILLAYLDLIRKSISLAYEDSVDFGDIHKAMDKLRARRQEGRITGLIVEGSAFMRNLYSSCLTDKHVDISTVQDGLEALGWLLKEKYHFVIMGSETKSLNGTALLYALRAAGGANRNIKSIMITSKAHPEFAPGMAPDYLLPKDKNLADRLYQTVREIADTKHA